MDVRNTRCLVHASLTYCIIKSYSSPGLCIFAEPHAMPLTQNMGKHLKGLKVSQTLSYILKLKVELFSFSVGQKVRAIPNYHFSVARQPRHQTRKMDDDKSPTVKN